MLSLSKATKSGLLRLNNRDNTFNPNIHYQTQVVNYKFFYK